MPPVMEETVFNAVTSNRNIARDLVANLANGILYKADGFYTAALNGHHHWGLPEGDLNYISPASRDNVQIVLETALGVPVELSSVNIEPDGNGDFIYEVLYYRLDDNGELLGELQEWTYAEGTEEFPTLTLGKLEQQSPYYPITPIRINNVNLLEEDGYEHKTDITQALQYLGIDPDNLMEGINGITEPEENGGQSENPPENMHIVLGIGIAEGSQAANEYLFRFFRKMYSGSRVKREDYEYWRANSKDTSQNPSNTLTIKDAEFKATLAWDYIEHALEEHIGSTVEPYTVQYSKNAGRVEYSERRIFSTAGIDIFHQVSPTQRIRYTVHGLVFKNYITDTKYVAVDLEDAFEDPDGQDTGSAFIVPLRKDICDEMGSVSAHDLIYESVRLYVNDLYTYKVKWYERGFGKIFVMIVVVIITVVFQQWYAGGWAAVTTAATGWAIASAVAMALVLSPLIAFLIEDVLGPELAIIATVLLALYAPTLVLGPSKDGLVSVTVTASTEVSKTALFQGALTAIDGISTLNFEKGMAEILEVSSELTSQLEEEYDKEMEAAYDVAAVYNMVSSDRYSSMEASTYVDRFKLQAREHSLLTQTTDKFTQLQQYVDRPNSMINLTI